MIVPIKPLSVNEAWQGKRFKTPAYKRYERDVLLLLPKSVVIPDGNLSLSVCWGFSNMQSDIDNGIKPFLDILQKKYGFNDNRVTNMNLRKVKVKKGDEYIEFSIEAGNN